MTKSKSKIENDPVKEEMGFSHNDDKYLNFLNGTIRLVVKVLAALMTLVIIWGIVDVVYVLYTRIMTPPILILKITDILAVFGAFLAVLIAIEIFLNITLYLREDIIHVKLVVSTALMAIARKIIILEYKSVEFHYVYASAALVLALGITHWLISKKRS